MGIDMGRITDIIRCITNKESEVTQRAEASFSKLGRLHVGNEIFLISKWVESCCVAMIIKMFVEGECSRYIEGTP